MLETADGVRGGVLRERAWPGVREQDARNGSVIDGAVGERVAEGGFEVCGRVALAQEQDLARAEGAVAREGGGKPREEGGRGGAHLLERGAQLVEIGDAGAVLPAAVDALRVDVLAGAARGERVARDDAQIGGVDEELVGRDAHGQDVGDLLVGHGVAIAFPGDEAVDAAEA